MRVAIEEDFRVLKQLAAIEPELGRVSGIDRVPVSCLEAPPPAWVDWFLREQLVMGFDTVGDPYRSVSLFVGKPNDLPDTLRISSEPDLMNDPLWLRRMLEAALPIWNAEEGKITVWKNGADRHWLHWLKGDRPPQGYRRRPAPEDWSLRTPLLDGMLYEWPEHRPEPKQTAP